MLPARLNFPKLSRSSYPSRRNNKYSNSTNGCRYGVAKRFSRFIESEVARSSWRLNNIYAHGVRLFTRVLERQVRLMRLKGFARGLNRASLSSVRLFLLSFHGFRKKKKNLKNWKLSWTFEILSRLTAVTMSKLAKQICPNFCKELRLNRLISEFLISKINF